MQEVLDLAHTMYYESRIIIWSKFSFCNWSWIDIYLLRKENKQKNWSTVADQIFAAWSVCPRLELCLILLIKGCTVFYLFQSRSFKSHAKLCELISSFDWSTKNACASVESKIKKAMHALTWLLVLFSWSFYAATVLHRPIWLPNVHRAWRLWTSAKKLPKYRVNADSENTNCI